MKIIAIPLAKRDAWSTIIILLNRRKPGKRSVLISAELVLSTSRLATAEDLCGLWNEMVMAGLPMGLEIPGEKAYLERLSAALGKELIAMGSEACIRAQDIEIDPVWVMEA
jgi:hypothetical protein